MRSAHQEPRRTNPFEPSNLSPVAKKPVACALPYDLTWDDLQSILPGFEESQSIHAQAFSSYEKQGLNGGANSCILTLCYPAGENQFRSETVFMKHATDPRSMEAQKYQALATFGIPTPRLLGDIQKNNNEIILLEFLPKIGIDFHSTEQVKSLLHLIAEVNSIQNPSHLFNPSPGMPQAEFDERVKSALTEAGRDRSLAITINIPRWFEAYKTARAACKSVPLAVNHNELYYQQVGWVQRDGINQLVIFDLETMCLCPRFTDMAGVLTSLAAYTGRSRLELFKIYLDRLRELNQLEIGIDEALHELRLVLVKGSFDSLPWQVGIANDGMLDSSLARTVNSLYEDLMALGFL